MRDERSQQAERGNALTSPKLGLAGRVLLLVIGFVMLAEVTIYVPSIANFREAWLRDRLSAASTAVLLLDATSTQVPDRLVNDALTAVGAQSIVLKMKDSRRLLASSDMPPRVDLR